MSLQTLTSLLKTLDSVGIVEAVIEPTDDDKTLIRGSNKDKNIIIFDRINEHIVDMPMGIQSIKGLLSRIMLFDEAKTSLDFKDNGTEISDLTIKQGRKKATYRFSSVEHLGVPKRVPEETPIGEITMSKDFVDYITNVIGAMSYTGTKQEQSISLSVEDGTAEISAYDGECDSFVDHFETGAGDVDKGTWETPPFKMAMSQSLKYSNDESAKLFITPTHKIAIFEIGMISVMVPSRV